MAKGAFSRAAGCEIRLRLSPCCQSFHERSVADFQIQRETAGDDTFLPVISLRHLREQQVARRPFEKEPKEGINVDL